ncbi:MAG: HAD family hydrolase [Oligoflexia bacterium]|nr:HAD family hydrolase [Oligoflexia bacterium]
MSKRPAILNEILKEAVTLKSSGTRLKAIFDLDSTLFDVSPRITKILHAFAELPEIKAKYRKESELLLTVKPHPEDYGVKRTLARYGFSLSPSAEFAQQLVDYWKKYFFGSDYLFHDVPYEGAVGFVNDLHNAGADIYYLTGRDVPRMQTGSVASLKQWGFPLNEDHANLILKPSTGIEDYNFKKEFFMKMDKTDGSVWFFENEPINIRLVLENCPHIKLVYVDTVHSESEAPPPPQVLRIKGYST